MLKIHVTFRIILLEDSQMLLSHFVVSFFFFLSPQTLMEIIRKWDGKIINYSIIFSFIGIHK